MARGLARVELAPDWWCGVTGREADLDRLAALVYEEGSRFSIALRTEEAKAVVRTILANPDVVLRALPPEAIRDWTLDHLEGLHAEIARRQAEWRP